MAKSYQLVAWTDKGQVKMIPSVLSEVVAPYLERIIELKEGIRYFTEYEVGDLLALSRAHERLGQVLLHLDSPMEAFREFAKAADCCLMCSDGHWIDRDRDFTVCRPLRGRFFAMYERCADMARRIPHLEHHLQETGLYGSREAITRAERVWRAEFDRGMEISRAWRFGQRSV